MRLFFGLYAGYWDSFWIIFWEISVTFGPEILIIPTPPVPGGVAIAAMVS